MIERIGNGGIVYNLELDLSKVMDYERTHPDWSIMDLFKGMESGALRFTDLDLLASFMDGFQGYEDFVDAGLDVNDLTEAISGSKYLGFSDGPTSAASPTQTA